MYGEGGRSNNHLRGNKTYMWYTAYRVVPSRFNAVRSMQDIYVVITFLARSIPIYSMLA